MLVTVDCRRARSWREALGDLAAALVHELADLSNSRVSVPPGALDAARVAMTVAALDRVELQETHERLTQFRSAASLGGGSSFLHSLRSEINISLERTARDIKALTGVVSIDELRVSRLLVALFADLRSAGLPSVVYLDNIDELDRHYRTESAVGRVQGEVEGLLRLRSAPIALVLNMRTYFAGALPREIPPPTRLGRLDPSVLMGVLERRLKDETLEVQAALGSPDAQEMLKGVAALAPTPLAFLDLVRFLVEDGVLSVRSLSEGMWRYVEARFASLSREDIALLIRAFARPNEPVDRARLLDSPRDEPLHAELERVQAVLPVDFWNPVRYSLDPFLHALHPASAGG